MREIVFTRHAAQRWFERCAELDFLSEMSRLKRDKQEERLVMRKGNMRRKVYRTLSGAMLIMDGKEVVTVIRY